MWSRLETRESRDEIVLILRARKVQNTIITTVAKTYKNISKAVSVYAWSSSKLYIGEVGLGAWATWVWVPMLPSGSHLSVSL